MAYPILEERFEYKGFPCVVLFQPMGFRCGYVGLSRESKYFRKDYDDIPIDCHGGLTYSERSLCFQEDKDIWWIGFDCGHCFDGCDIEKTEQYYGLESAGRLMESFHYLEPYPVRDFDYCKEQCMSIVEQLLLEREE